MAQVKTGDTVAVHYRGQLADGSVFDSSEGREPLLFRVGDGQVIPGFDHAVMGMNVGDKKTETIPASQAYGPHHPENVLRLDRSQVPDEMEVEVGQGLRLEDEQGHSFDVRVAEITPEEIVLDGNHPLAGQDLTFTIELVEVRP